MDSVISEEVKAIELIKTKQESPIPVFRIELFMVASVGIVRKEGASCSSFIFAFLKFFDHVLQDNKNLLILAYSYNSFAFHCLLYFNKSMFVAWPNRFLSSNPRTHTAYSPLNYQILDLQVSWFRQRWIPRWNTPNYRHIFKKIMMFPCFSFSTSTSLSCLSLISTSFTSSIMRTHSSSSWGVGGKNQEKPYDKACPNCY